MEVRRKKSKASIKDVAEKSGVSTATVSHVINGTRYVSEEVKMKVKNAMKELNYVPNPMARTLRSQESKLIGLIIPVKDYSDTANMFFMAMAQGIEKTLTKNGYKLLLTNSYEDQEIEKERVSMYHAQLVDGLIIAPIGDDYSFMNDLVSSQYPVVFVDRKPQVFSGDCVVANNYKGAYEATSHLIKKGHKKIGFISGNMELTTSNDRLNGYKKALLDNGLSYRDEFVKESMVTLENGYKHAEELLQKNKVSAIFIANNTLTMGAISYFQEKGIKIPDEIAIVGFDDYEWNKVINPPLTTVKQPAFEMGQKAAEVLLDKISNKKETGEYLLDTTLIIRKSS